MGACQSNKATSGGGGGAVTTSSSPSSAAAQSKSNAASPKRTEEEDSERAMEGLTNTTHDPTKTTRQRMAWHREDMDIEHVYDVLEIVGQGSMGEVCIIRKKPEFVEKSHERRRTAASVATVDLDVVGRGSECLANGDAGGSNGGDGGEGGRDDGGAGAGASDEAAKEESAQPADSPSSGESACGRMFACKTVNTVRMKKDEVEEFINEIDILRDLDHPNIIQMFEIFSTKRKIWIVQELCTGGDLGERARSFEMSEADVAVVIEQILRAVAYMHKRHVCHRDIKFENIMYADDSPDAAIKLIDFGLSNKFTKNEKMLKACGTIYTAAPEVLLGGGASEQSDIWSIGVIAYILLSTEYPFLRELEELEDEDKREKLENARYVMGPGWKRRNVSRHGKEFVARCLRKHPGARWSAVEALDYVQKEWIPYLMKEADEKKKASSSSSSCSSPARAAPSDGNMHVRFSTQTAMSSITEGASVTSHGNEEKSSSSFDEHEPLRKSVASMKQRTRMHSGMLAGMTTFADSGEFKKRILMTMAYTMDKSSLTELQDTFTVLDSNNSGTISLKELKLALRKMHSDKHFDEHTIEKLFHGVDIDNSGQIHYAEFLAAVMESQGLITMERLADAFDRLDSSGKGYISKDDLKSILGSDYNEELVNKMIAEADFKKNGQIDYDEFLRLMFDKDPAKGMETVAPDRNLHLDSSMVDRLASFESDK